MVGAEYNRKVINAAYELKKAHELALGSLQIAMDELQLQKSNEIKALEKRQTREFATVKTKASNAVLAAQYKTLNSAASLFSSEGEKRCAEYIQIGEILVNAKNSGLSNELSIPMVIPFLGRGNIFLRGAEDFTDDMMRNLIIESIINTDLSDLSLTIFDPKIRNSLASFSGLNQVQDGLYEVFNTDRELQDVLKSIRDRITNIANITRGVSGSVVDYVNSTGDLPEPYKVMVFLDYPTGVSEQTHNQILPIIQSANDAGISCIFQLSKSDTYPDWFDVNSLIKLGAVFDMSKGRTIWSENRSLNIAVPQISQANIVKRLTGYAESARKALNIDLEDIVKNSIWNESSEKGLTFAFAGKNKHRIDITLGDALVHGLITGATGEGKSNLIKVLIYDLASRYSPDELQFMLLDFKEGVTLAPLAPSDDSPDYLPQARVLGLEADQEYGLSVLYEIERIYKRRMAQMKPFDNIKSYRASNPNAVMPRILVIIDEFQGLLAEDENRVGQEASKKLLDLIRTVRAAGIHFILATQEIGSIASLVGKRDGLLSQLKLRVGLRNTPKEAMQTFELGNDAASKLKVKGEVVINELFGDIDGNVIGRVPFAPDDKLNALRKGWWEACKDTTNPPMVFEGSKLASWNIDWHKRELLDGLKINNEMPSVLLGHPISVAQNPIVFDFDRIPGRNIAVVGSPTDVDLVSNRLDSVAHPLATIESIGCALSKQFVNKNAEFVFMDMLSGQEKQVGKVNEWLAYMQSTNSSFKIIHQAEVQDWIESMYEELGERNFESDPIFVFGLGVDRMGSLDSKYKNTFKKVSQILQELWENGSSVGVHFINWWSSSESFLTHVNRQVEKYFSGVMLYSGTNSAVKRVIGPLSSWNGEDKRAIYRDYAGACDAAKIIPYALPKFGDNENEAVNNNDRF